MSAFSFVVTMKVVIRDEGSCDHGQSKVIDARLARKTIVVSFIVDRTVIRHR